VVLLSAGAERHVELAAGEVVVVPKGTWHRFEGSRSLKVMSVTPHRPTMRSNAPPPNPSLHPKCYSGLRPLPHSGELKR
jgi:quercetin dioxygenase-like cupin family protein